MLAALLSLSLNAFAQRPLGPCHVKSRALALIKTCYTGDMGRPVDGGSQFFAALTTPEDGANYCYNDFVMMEQKPTDKNVQVRVLRDSKQGQLEEYDYAISLEELKNSKIDTPYVSLRGLSGKCYSASGAPAKCPSNFMTWFGFKERDLPLTLALGKTALGTYTVSHLVTDRAEIKNHSGQRLHPRLSNDTRYAVYQTAQEIQHRLMSYTQTKTVALRQSGMTPKKMSESSEQFRFCAIALESFLKENKLPDLMNEQSKNDLARLTSYMNASDERSPASVKR